jgi:hypothetical protein
MRTRFKTFFIYSLILLRIYDIILSCMNAQIQMNYSLSIRIKNNICNISILYKPKNEMMYVSKPTTPTQKTKSNNLERRIRKVSFSLFQCDVLTSKQE